MLTCSAPVDLAAIWDWLGSSVRPPETYPIPCGRSGRRWLLLTILVAAWPRC